MINHVHIFISLLTHHPRALSRSHANAKSLTHKITCRKTQIHLNDKAHIHRSEKMIFH